VLTLPPSVRIYLAVEPVDLRRGHDGLSAIVRGQWGEDLFAGHLFVFLGRRRDRCKILFWDRGGLVLYYKTTTKEVPKFSAYATEFMETYVLANNKPSERSMKACICATAAISTASR
jgi:hypothetical protein